MQTQINFETKSYHNTIKVYGQELKEATETAESQERVIENFFKCNPANEFTPFTIQELLDFECINSVRRSITNLTKKGILRKTGNKVSSYFGKKNNCWRYNEENN